MTNIKIAAILLLLYISSHDAKCQDLNKSGFTFTSEQWADSVLETMTLKEKIGQLFMVDAYSNWNDDQISNFEAILRINQPGGIIFFQGTKERQLELLDKWNKKAKLNYLVGMDAEWGTSMRLSGEMWMPRAMQLGAVQNLVTLTKMGEVIGSQCVNAGVNINFAPVLDLNINANNPVINYRSFGEDPELVSNQTYAFYKGMQSKGVLAIGKHFPGHGNTTIDSHVGLPVVNAGWLELAKGELYPFKQACQSGIAGIMTGHLSVPSLDSTNTPASLSKTIVTDILKDQWKFRGLIVSDALNMQAVSGRYNNHYLRAFEAGNDILLFPASLKKAFAEIEQGIKDGNITELDVTNRAKKMLQTKYLLGVQRVSPVADFDRKIADAVVHQAVKESLTLIENHGNTLPLSNMNVKSVVVSVGEHKGDSFYKALSKYGRFDQISLNDKSGAISSAVANLTDYDRIIVTVYGTNYGMKNNYGLNGDVQELLAFLPASKEIIGVILANPYALKSCSEAFLDKWDALLLGYDNHPIIQNYCAQVIGGGLSAKGRLPITISQRYPAGSGIATFKTRLGNTLPILESMDATKLLSIDTLVADAIEDGATPGCQIVVVKNGNVVWDKCYGYHTYAKTSAVKWTDLYDVASITKAVSTTPAIMQLYGQNVLQLEQCVGDFDGLARDSFKKDITIRQMLLHQSGMQPFIPFYLQLFDDAKLKEGLFSKNKSSIFSIPIGTGIYANRKVTFKKGFMNKKRSKAFPIHLTEKINFYAALKDSIDLWIDTSKVDSSKTYRYSDLNYYYLKNIVEWTTHTSLDHFTDSLFYTPLGMNRTSFNPLSKFKKEELVPTENDLFFRKKLVQGTVHDQGAALQNGVGGHAGLFSNAHDMAKFSQMMLNGGSYGGHQYFKWKTIDYFTNAGNSENRRALGFDKAEPDPTKESPVCPSASLLSYGHTGFTGTMVWIDPAYDLIYIFLSNRIHPNADNRKLIDNNIRTNIQEVIYQSMIK